MPEAAPAELPGQMCHRCGRGPVLLSSVGFGNVGHRASTQPWGSQHPWEAPSFPKLLPHPDLTAAPTASGPFFHLSNAFALLPFLPQQDRTLRVQRGICPKEVQELGKSPVQTD